MFSTKNTGHLSEFTQKVLFEISNKNTSNSPLKINSK